MKAVAPRHFALILGVALATLFAAPAAHAGTKEIAAITAKLPSGKTIATASNTELSTAVIAAMKDPANAKLNQATIASEALKGAVLATNIGTQLSTDILADLANLPKVSDNIQKFVGASSKASATGANANPNQIPTFAAGFIARVATLTDRNAEAIAIASFASGSTTAIGAIIGGRTLNGDAEVTGDAKLIALANQAIQTKKLASSVQQISQYVGDAATDASTFTVGVIQATGSSGKDNSKNLAKIATGVTTSNPTAASDILNALYAGDIVSSPLFLATVKNSTTLAKNLGLVADAEEVSQVAAEFGKRIGKVNPSTGKIVGIKQSSINSIAKSLVTGLATRATGTGVNNLLRNSYSNRLDEIGEVGAYLLDSIKGLPVFTVNSKANIKSAPSLVTGLMKTIIGASLKVYSNAAAAVNPKKAIVKDPNFQAIVAEDLAGSIALTLRMMESTLDPGIYAAIRTALLSPGVGKKIGGGSKTTFNIDGTTAPVSTLIENALTAVLGDMENNLTTLDTKYKKYENGSNPVYAQGPFNDPDRGTITEPETDIRNH